MTDTDGSAALRHEELAAVLARLRDDGPLHYFDCERFNVTNYGLRQGTCDCTATADVAAALAALERVEGQVNKVKAALLRRYWPTAHAFSYAVADIVGVKHD